MKLIEMTDFVLEQNKEPYFYYDSLWNKVIAYANFLKQPLTLGMFVPCLPSGEPFDKFQLEILNSQDLVPELRDAYKTAKSKVVFSQFRVIENDSKSHPKTVQFQNLVNAFWFLTETNSWHISKGLKKVEDLIPYNPDLAISF
jgi:DNA-directed RNA polymerase delta subunit